MPTIVFLDFGSCTFLLLGYFCMNITAHMVCAWMDDGCTQHCVDCGWPSVSPNKPPCTRHVFGLRTSGVRFEMAMDNLVTAAMNNSGEEPSLSVYQRALDNLRAVYQAAVEEARADTLQSLEAHAKVESLVAEARAAGRREMAREALEYRGGRGLPSLIHWLEAESNGAEKEVAGK